MQNARAGRAEPLSFLIMPIVFLAFLFSSRSSLLKVPNDHAKRRASLSTTLTFLFQPFVFDNEDEEKDLDVGLPKFEGYYFAATNEIYERYKLNLKTRLIPSLLPFAASLRHAIMAHYQIIS